MRLCTDRQTLSEANTATLTHVDDDALSVDASSLVVVQTIADHIDIHTYAVRTGEHCVPDSEVEVDRCPPW